MLRVPTLVYCATVALVLTLNVVSVTAYVHHASRLPAPAVPSQPDQADQPESPGRPATLVEQVRARLEDDPETKGPGVKLSEVSLEDGRLRLEGFVARADLKARVEQAARDVAHAAGDLECRNNLRDSLDLLRETFPVLSPPGKVLLTDARLAEGVLTLRGLVVEVSLKGDVERVSKEKIVRTFGPVVQRCDLGGLLTLREAVEKAVAAEQRGVQLSEVRVVTRAEEGKSKRVVVLTGTAPTRAAAYAAAETAQKLLNKHGFAIDEWDRHYIKIEADNPKPK